ncbi:MAG: Zn-ribbon domain-containing OB-fold protein [Candidatus Helarchaeota archaeon]
MSDTTIIWNKCKKCGKIQHIDHLRCLRCKNTTFNTVKSSGDCTLLTFTILRAPPAEFREQKAYALGVVEFSNGVRALGQLTTTENLHIGLKLQPIFSKLTSNLDGREVFGVKYSPMT